MANEQIVRADQKSAFESPWTVEQRVRRVLWEFCWTIFCAPTPKPFNG
jgi:putative colanic acid biosynthesis acetyltransferase WcaF